MVFVSLASGLALSAEQVLQGLKERGVLVGATSARQFRLVTHYWVDDQGVEKAIQAFQEVLA
jgi:threonine aldolase